MTVEINRSLLIEADPSTVWGALAEFASISAWAPNVDHSSAASVQRTEVGAVRRVQVGRIALLERITDWQPGSTLAYTVNGLPPVAGQITTTWRLTPADKGATATTVTVTTVIVPTAGPPGRIASRVVGRRMSTAANDMLHGLADHLHQTGVQT